MGCTDAYREALTRAHQSTASAPTPARAPAPAASQHQAAEADREGVERGPILATSPNAPESDLEARAF